ncbi:BTA121 domain-containing protein surface lipoprotein [Borrelia hermsii]|uniref:Lipoprotein n=2 Tax=Borrelia hermsii TaxID=140 RepID=T1ECG0_BORHE|nr:hypothetical protein [Borrelia hermsii]ADN26404.1 hypothetical protein BHA146 [Borrelia hermsii]AMR75983.1 hypothetical protein A0V01_05055 [Borrelia hermsii]ANA43788.1 Mrl-type protein [Borrelia hermsii HS1]UPA08581.1 hypothetical protein bhDAH_001294 [Borrelia hermsii DAH]
MIKVGRYCTLLIIILIISCKSDAQDGIASGGNPIRVKTAAEGIKAKIDKLLGTFRLQSEEREAFKYIQRAVTDSNAGLSGDRTYSDSEFYDLLVGLGDVRLREIIKVYLGIYKAKRAVETDIEGVKEDALKQQLKYGLEVEESFYLRELKQVFNESTPGEVYNKVRNMRNLNKFATVKASIRQISELEELCASLSDDESRVVWYMRSVLTNSNIARGYGYSTYSNDSFYSLFKNNLNDARLKEVIGFHIVHVKALYEAKAVIKDIKKEGLRLQLQGKLGVRKNDYALELKRIFSPSSFDQIYNKAIDSNANSNINPAVEFTKIKNEALAIIAADQGNP